MINNVAYFGEAATDKGANGDGASAGKDKASNGADATAAAAGSEQKPILFTANGGAESGKTDAATIQQMDEHYTRMRRMSQRAISTLRKTKKLNDEELEATMLSISERIREGDIVVASSLFNAAGPNEKITFSIGSDPSDAENQQSATAMVKSDSHEALHVTRPHRAQALSHLPPLQRDGSAGNGLDSSGSAEPLSPTSGSSRRGNRKRDVPFALKDDELKNLQAEIDIAKGEDDHRALPAALSAPSDINGTRRKSRRSTNSHHRRGSGEGRKHKSGSKKSKSKRHESHRPSSRTKDSAASSASAPSISHTSSSASGSKKTREYRRESRERRESTEKVPDAVLSSSPSSDKADTPKITSTESLSSPVVESTTLAASTTITKASTADSALETLPPSDNPDAVDTRPRRAASAAPFARPAPGSTIGETSSSISSISGSSVAVAEDNREPAKKDRTTSDPTEPVVGDSSVTSPRSDDGTEEHSDAEEDDEDDDDPLRGIQNELLSALLGEAVADSDADDDAEALLSPKAEDDDDDTSEEQHDTSDDDS